MSGGLVSLDRVAVVAANGATRLRDLSLSVAEGETLALLGRSGSGKTTALRLMNAMLMPTGGDVRVAGRSTRDWNTIELRRRTGYVIQEAGLLPHWTVAANVGLVPRLESWEPARIAARVRAMLELVGLPPEKFAARRPRELSGGERQRVGFARALAADPPLLLLDEPFGALDPITRRALQAELQSWQQQIRKTIVLVTHDVGEAMRLAHRVVLLEQGAAIASGTPSELRGSADPRVREFLGIDTEVAGAA